MIISFPNSPPGSKVEGQGNVQSAANDSLKVAGRGQALERAPEPEISLSETGVQALRAQLATEPGIRAERVMALQTAIQNGVYTASSQQIAEAIHADLFGTPSNAGSQS